jgi:hypothetical protein
MRGEDRPLGPVDAGKRSVAVAAEKVERSPAERDGDSAERPVEEENDVVDEALPAVPWYAFGRPGGIEPGETFRPGARDAALVFDDRAAFFFGLHERRERRRRGLCSSFNFLKMFKSRCRGGVLNILNISNTAQG